tara:strand:- start:773 stop:1483 length:711 start_codon:yes stop_codon:yes gene_type:complete
MIPKNFKALITTFGWFLLLLPCLNFAQAESEEAITLKYKYPGMNFYREVLVKGSVYLDGAFQTGEWVVNGKYRKEAKMRYNAYRDIFELQGPNHKITTLVKDPQMEAILQGKLYRYIDYLDHNNLKSGYFTPLNKGTTLLYARAIKVIPQLHFPEHGYETFKAPEFQLELSYYIKRVGRPAVKLSGLGKKEVFAVLWDRFSELKKFAKKNGLHLRSEEEVVKALQYYDTLALENIN